MWSMVPWTSLHRSRSLWMARTTGDFVATTTYPGADVCRWFSCPKWSQVGVADDGITTSKVTHFNHWCYSCGPWGEHVPMVFVQMTETGQHMLPWQLQNSVFWWLISSFNKFQHVLTCFSYYVCVMHPTKCIYINVLKNRSSQWWSTSWRMSSMAFRGFGAIGPWGWLDAKWQGNHWIFGSKLPICSKPCAGLGCLERWKEVAALGVYLVLWIL